MSSPENQSDVFESNVLAGELEVFVSHRSTDADHSLAVKLVEELRARGINCFLDTKDIHGGDSFIRTILSHVHESRVVLVLVNGEMSSWVHFEAACAFFDEKLMPVSVNDTEIPLPYRRIQNHSIIVSEDGEVEKEALQAVANEVERRLHGSGSDAFFTRLYRRINSLFFSGVWIILALASSAIVIIGNVTENSYLHLHHLHVTFGAAILGGQFFLSLGFARVISSPSFRARDNGFRSIEKLFFVWIAIALLQLVLGISMVDMTFSLHSMPAWIWFSISLYLASLLCFGAGYAVAKSARELDRAHRNPRQISGRHLIANLLFLIAFLLTVLVINIMIEKDRIFSGQTAHLSGYSQPHQRWQT